MGAADAFNDRCLGGVHDLVGQELGHLVSAFFVVHADEGHGLHGNSRHGLRAQPVVNVDDVDAGVLRFFQHWHQPHGIARRNHNRLGVGLDFLFDQLNLLLNRGFLRRCLDLQIGL